MPRRPTAKQVANEVQALSEQLNAAVKAGDLETADDLQRRLTRLVARLNSAIADASPDEHVSRPPGPTQREVVLSVVATMGDVTPARLVRDIAMVDGTPIKSTGFPAMLRSDERSWRSHRGRKPVLLLPGIEATTMSPMSSWIALSTFPTDHRIVTPLTPRAAHLRAILHVADRLASTPAGSTVAEGLAALARRWSVALPELRSFGTPDPVALREQVSEILAGIDAAEDAQRAEAAVRVEAAPADIALFGFRDLTVMEGGREKAK